MPQYALLMYHPHEGPPAEQMGELHQRWQQFAQDLQGRRLARLQPGAERDRRRHDRAGARRRDAGDRRPVRRDEGAARRLSTSSSAPTSTRRSSGRREHPEHQLRLRRGAAGLVE